MITCSKKDGRAVVTLEDGTEMSRKAYILKRYTEDNAKRGDIAKELGVPVQVIFAFTRNIANEHHTPGVGRAKIEDVANPETGEVAPRAQVIKDLIAGGKTRKEVAKLLGVSYQAVYSVTKPPKAKGEAVEGEAPVEGEVAEVAEGEAPVEAVEGKRKHRGIF